MLQELAIVGHQCLLKSRYFVYYSVKSLFVFFLLAMNILFKFDLLTFNVLVLVVVNKK
jgi:hypothetical protein